MMDRLVIRRRRFMGVDRQHLHKFLEKCYIFQESMLHIWADLEQSCPLLTCRCDMSMPAVLEFVTYSHPFSAAAMKLEKDVAHAEGYSGS